MGQAQSGTGQDGARAQAEESERKADYYELLGVERDASEEELKKAYRRKALELHPDRNFGNAEAATKLFADVQAAYEVLSDPQERAWYDSHRDAFLGTGEWSGMDQSPYTTDSTTTADIMKLFSKFNPRMEFSDSSTGFFGALREVFDKLADEETRACQWENIDPMEWPTFGKSEDDFESVVRPFYAAWSNFSTRKSFSWLDQYRYSDAPDRRVRRLMEKENRRLREESIREYNDAVRSLVSFVKKRDPRYRSNAQSEAQRQEALRKSTAAQAMRSRAANSARLREHVIPDWAKSEEPEYDSSTSSEHEQEQFECVVCRKNFKSQRQFEAHERSKKHVKAVKQLCWEMRMQDEQLRAGDERVDILASEIDVPPLDVPLMDPARVSYDVAEDKGTLDAHAESSGTDTLPHAYDRRSATSSEGDAEELDDRVESESTVSRGGSSDELDGNPIDIISQDLESSNLDQVTPQKIGKAKLKRSKKAATSTPSQSSNLRCATCNASFPSRTKLFDHIRDLRHAAPQNQTTGSGGKSSKKKR